MTAQHIMLKQNRLRVFFIFLIFFLVYLGLRSHTVLGRLVHDDGLFLAGSQAWAYGYIPYIGFWDHKPPCVFLYNAIPLIFFPFSLIAVKGFHCVVLAGSAVLLFEFCKRYVHWAASLITCLFYIYFTSMRYTIQSGGLTEEGALIFVILAYWLLSVTQSKQWWMTLLAGISIGFAVQFRQTFVVEAGFAVGLIWLNEKTVKQSIPQVLWLAFGMLIPEILFSLYFLICGAWWDYFQASYLYNFYYIGPARPDTSWAEIWQRQNEIIHNTGIYLLCPFIAGLFCVWMNSLLRWMCLFLAISFLGDLIAISLSGEYYAHYYVQASVTCAIFLAFTIHTIIQSWKTISLQFMPAVKVLSILFVLLTAYLGYQSGTRCYLTYNQTLAEREQPNSQYTFQRDVANAVNQITSLNDKILLIGRVPNSVYFLSERLIGSRFYHYSPLWKPSLKGALTERQKQKFLEDMQTHQPTLLLMDLTRLRSDNGLDRVERHVPSALPFIQENYTRLDELYPGVITLWDWYDIRLQIMVRNEQADEVVERLSSLSE